MRTHATLMAVCVVISVGCGDGNDRPRSTATAHPSPPTSTPTLTPMPRVTPTPRDCDCEGSTLSVSTISLPGGDLDLGWTGLWHNLVATHDSLITTNLDCVGPDCIIDGTHLVGQAFGSPLPLSAGGISTCILSSIREAVTGIYDCCTHCSKLSVKLLSKVFLAQEAAMPCPPCVGDPTPNDGVKGGICSGGKTAGAACDVGGISDLFDAAGPEFGHTSNDCLPTGSSVGELDIDVSPLTTGTISIDTNVSCLEGGDCYCPTQARPNACQPHGTPCPASGVCENGPVDSVCSGQTFRQCRSGTGTADCDGVFPGAGSCVDEPRLCFGDTISRTGTCGTQTGTLVALFCIPQTREAAVDAIAGLPGPGAITLPVSRVRTPR